MQLDEHDYLRTVERLDRRLLQDGLAQRRVATAVDGSLDMARSLQADGLWPTWIVTQLLEAGHDDLLRIHWITERYYGDLIRQHTASPLRSDYILLAYARIISIRMLYNCNMGYCRRQLLFVVAAIRMFSPGS